MNHIEFGQKGEKLAKEYLENLGFTLIHSNYRASHAEVDLIMQDGNEVVFIEVKTRSYDYYGSPEEFVDQNKQDNMAFAASLYMIDNEYEGEIRFDIVAIILNVGLQKIKHIKDAFFPGL